MIDNRGSDCQVSEEVLRELAPALRAHGIESLFYWAPDADYRVF